jgi:hypothetical protein
MAAWQDILWKKVHIPPDFVVKDAAAIEILLK